MVKFRNRFNANRLAKINEHILLAETKQKAMQKEQDNDHHDDQNGSGTVAVIQPAETKVKTPEATPNQGTLILDATCTPVDMRFPTDLGLLNDARNKLDEMIDTLHNANGKIERRPRTYQEKARKDYLAVSKRRKPRKNMIRQAIKKQLQYAK
jgi:hypothetical protein